MDTFVHNDTTAHGAKVENIATPVNGKTGRDSSYLYNLIEDRTFKES